MARIRSIKPEFPQSESMGNVSRDSRLTFIQLWTIADDEGRLRGNSRMLASLLFPYDDDAPSLIDGWLSELESEGCIIRYKAGAQSYVQLCNWTTHQKIDKPSKSKIPAPLESSREVANPREVSSEEGIKDQGEEGKGAEEPARADDEIAPATLLSIAMRRAGIESQPADPRLIALAEQGVTPATVTAACTEAKQAKPNERIGVAYVVAILNRWSADASKVSAAGAQQPPTRGAPGLNEKFHFSHLDRSGDRRAMEASMKRHGITVPAGDEEIEI